MLDREEFEAQFNADVQIAAMHGSMVYGALALIGLLLMHGPGVGSGSTYSLAGAALAIASAFFAYVNYAGLVARNDAAVFYGMLASLCAGVGSFALLAAPLWL